MLTRVSDTEPGRTVLFDDAMEQFVEYDERDGLEKRKIQMRKPDRVFGLARTSSLDAYTKKDIFKDLRHGPFSDSDLLYPFLVCEAKSEDSKPSKHKLHFPFEPA
jgi:hypothetical protein